MTIHEHDSLRSDDADRTSVQALVDRLNAGEPYAVAFGGQGNSAWLSNLEELVTMAGIESELATVVGEAELLLEPVADELVVVRPIGFEPLRWVRQIAAEEPAPSTRHLTSAAVSLPGVLLSQIAAIRALYRQGLDLTGAPPVAVALGDRLEDACVEAVRYGADRDQVTAAARAARPPDNVSWNTEIDLGGRSVQVIHPGAGHTDHDLIVVAPTNPPVVFCGDLVEESADPAVGDDSEPGAWPDTLNQVLAVGGDAGVQALATASAPVAPGTVVR